MSNKLFIFFKTFFKVVLVLSAIACVIWVIYLINTRNKKFFSAVDSGVDKFNSLKEDLLQKCPICKK